MTTPQLNDKVLEKNSEAAADLYPAQTAENTLLPSTSQHPTRENWDKDWVKRLQFKGHEDKVVTCLQFDADKIVAGYDSQVIEIFDIRSGERLQRLEGHEGGVWCLQFVGNTLVSGATDRTVRVWDIEKGVCTHVLRHHSSTVRCLQIVLPVNVNTDPKGVPRYEPEFPVIVSGSRDATLAVWRLPDPERNGHLSPTDTDAWLLHSLSGHTLSIRDIAAEGSTLISGSYDTTVGVWNICTGALVHRLHGHTQKVYSVALDRTRNICMSGSMDSDIRVWSLEDGTCLHVLQGHESLVGLLRWSPVSGHLVSASADNTLRIWDPVLGVCLHTLTGHDAAITGFHSDDKKIISGSDGSLRLWDFKTGKYLRTLLTGMAFIWQVKFDERRCVAAMRYQHGTDEDYTESTYFEVLDYGDHGDHGTTEDDVDNASLTPVTIDNNLADNATDTSRKRKTEDPLEEGSNKEFRNVE